MEQWCLTTGIGAPIFDTGGMSPVIFADDHQDIPYSAVPCVVATSLTPSESFYFHFFIIFIMFAITVFGVVSFIRKLSK